VIARDDMMVPILTASPSFDPVWQAFVAEWQDDPKGLPYYLALTDLARHIAQLIQRNAEIELQQIFRAVEDWHIDGDPYVKEAATVGLLEDLQNSNVVGKEVPSKVLRYLGPESARWWRKVEDFWERGILIRDK
jgi:hypothetical protein